MMEPGRSSPSKCAKPVMEFGSSRRGRRVPSDFESMVGTALYVSCHEGRRLSGIPDRYLVADANRAGDLDLTASLSWKTRALDGPQSCSVVRDPRLVVLASGEEVTADDFWADEFVANRPLLKRIEELVIC